MQILTFPHLLLDAVAPVRCAGCGEWGEHLCFVCEGRLAAKPRPAIERGVTAAFEYTEPVDRIIHAAKYGDGRTALRRLAELAGPRLGVTAGDVLVPVPLGRRRRRGRGYNQAAVIARVWSEQAGAVVIENQLLRVRETRPQVGRAREAREGNVAGAFATAARLGSGEERVIVVDDVCTTGATLRAAARALREAGAGSVRAAVLARAI